MQQQEPLVPRAGLHVGAAPRRGLTLVTVCLAVLIAQVDTSVVNLAMHPIGSYFLAGVPALQWVIDSYNVVYAAMLLPGGLLADLYGRRRIFSAGAALFVAASLLGAFAPSVSLLIAARAFAGLGAALMIPASLAIIRVVWPGPAERGRVLGVWAACNGVALAIGPTLGGLLIGWFGWRSIFLLAVPLGVAALALAAFAVPESSDPEGRRMDFSGQVLGALTLGALVMAGIEIQHSPAMALTALAIAAGSLVLFLICEARLGAAAMVPLDLLRHREFAAAATATAGMTFGMYGALFLVPLTWQSTGSLDAVQAGVALLPMAAAFVVVSPFSGALAQRFGARLLPSVGVAIIGIGLVTTGVTAAWGSLAVTEIGLTLAGLGMGFATGPLFGVAVGAVPSARSGTAAALINVARMAGATLGVALLGTAFAAAGGDTAGLKVAMVAGGLVQLTGAAIMWRATRAGTSTTFSAV